MNESSERVVKFPEKMGFFGLSTASNIVTNFKSIYYLIFLTNVLKIPVLTAGTMMTIGTIWDIVNDPLIAVWANNIHFKSGERIRPYLAWVSVPLAAGMVLLFTDFNLGQRAAIFVSLVIFFFYEIACTVRGIAYNGLGALASKNEEDRKSINAYRSLGGCVGTGIGSVAVAPLVKLFGGLKEKDAIIGKGDAPALFKAALVMGALCVIGCLLQYFTTRERVHEEEVHEDKISIVETYRMLFKCKSWVWNMLYIMCYGVCLTLIMNAINYYAAYILGASGKATPILAVYLVVAIVISVLAPKIDSLLGRKKCMYFAAAIQILGKVPFVINPYNPVNIYINAISVGIGTTLAFVILNTNRNNIADVVELQNHRRLDAVVSTADNLASKIAEACVIQMIAFSLAGAGFDESLGAAQTLATKRTICALLGWIPCIVLILMLVAAYFMNIEKEKQQALDKRAQESA